MLNRLIGFYGRAGWTGYGYLIIIFAFPFLGIPQSFNRPVVFGTLALLFFASYFFRYLVVRTSPTSLTALRLSMTLVALACLFIYFGKFGPQSRLIVMIAAAFIMGLQFWAVSDDAYDMFTWAAHPLEFGQSPTDLKLWHITTVTWDKYGPTTAKLWHFVCNGKPYIGITGPITFAIDDGSFHNLKPDAVLERYRTWYTNEQIEDLMNSQTDEPKTKP